MSALPLTPKPASALAPTARLGRWSALPVLMAAAFMVSLDFFIVNVAMPAIQSDLAASSGAIEWVVAGYGLTMAGGLILGGRLGDRFGRRRMFSTGLAAFTVASLICGLAPSPAVLVAARMLQGVAASLMAPQILSIIGVTYEGEDRAKALGVYGVVMGLGAVGGQIVGGLLLEADVLGLGWRAVFLINLPVGIVALVLAARMVPESRAPSAAKLDLAGAELVTLGLVAVILPLIEGRQHGWPAWTWISLAAAPALLGLFALHQRRLAARGREPLLHPELFRHRTFTAGLLGQIVFWSGQASFFLVFALYLQQGRGLSAIDSGLVFAILALAYLVASMQAPKLGTRLGRGAIVLGGASLLAGHALLALGLSRVGVGGSLLELVPGMLVIGAGMGLVIAPSQAIVLGSLDPARAGAAAGALSTAQQVGNALGVAITGVVFFGALDGGAGHAFEVSEIQLAGVGALVVLFALLLPRRQAARVS